MRTVRSKAELREALLEPRRQGKRTAWSRRWVTSTKGTCR